MICNLCPRKCGADRSKGIGFCKAPDKFKLARAALHFWEEPPISGINGSGAVFFSGCNLKCVFCQNYEISSMCKGVEISDDRLIEIFDSLVEQGAHNINLVNPTHYVSRIANVLSKWKSPVPIVYNTSSYEDIQALKMLDGLIDIYLPDLKYIRNSVSEKYSFCKDYFDVSSKAIEEMKRQCPECVYDDNGIMQKGMIIRHLILPSNTNSSLEIIDYLSENYSTTPISLMAQYTPCNNLERYPEIDRRLTKREYEKVISYAESKPFETIFIQELSSSAKDFIPEFDFTGIM